MEKEKGIWLHDTLTSLIPSWGHCGAQPPATLIKLQTAYVKACLWDIIGPRNVA